MCNSKDKVLVQIYTYIYTKLQEQGPGLYMFKNKFQGQGPRRYVYIYIYLQGQGPGLHMFINTPQGQSPGLYIYICIYICIDIYIYICF